LRVDFKYTMIRDNFARAEARGGHKQKAGRRTGTETESRNRNRKQAQAPAQVNDQAPGQNRGNTGARRHSSSFRVWPDLRGGISSNSASSISSRLLDPDLRERPGPNPPPPR